MLLLLSTTWAVTLSVGSSQSYTTLQAAVNAAADGDIIEVDAGTYAESVRVDKDLTITTSAGAVIAPPSGKNGFFLDGAEVSLSGFTIEGANKSAIKIDGGEVTLDDLTIDGGGDSAIDGGGVWISDATVWIVDLTVEDTVGRKGGALYIVEGSVVDLDSVTLEGCSASWGGGVRVEDSTLTGDDVTIEDASATYNGGAWFIDGSTVSLSSVTVSTPSTGADGGGFYVDGHSSVSIDGGEVTDALSTKYSTDGEGAGARIEGGSSVSFIDFTFQDGLAYRGGAISVDSGATVSLDTVTLDGNDATRSGGALDLASSGVSATCSTCTFSDNSAKEGGAVNVESGASYDDDSGEYSGNIAQTGGAVYLQAEGSFLNSSFDGNEATTGPGGAIYGYLVNGTVTVQGGFFSSNVASDDGGAISANNKTALTVSDSSFSYNDSGASGGAIAFTPNVTTSWDLQVEESSFDGNSSAAMGGALFVDKGADIGLDTLWVDANTAKNGAGVYITGSYEVQVVRCDIHNNVATTNGGGAFEKDTVTQGSWTNNAFTENSAISGGALYLENTVDVELTNNTLLANDASATGAHIYIHLGTMELVNNVLAYGVDGGGVWCDATGATSDLFYNAVYQNAGNHYVGDCVDPTGSSGNIEDDPTLKGYSIDADASNDDLHLDLLSPCIDTGHPAITDVDGTRSDIGVYGGPEATVSDEDGDGWYDTVDCDDGDSSINPGATEVPYDGIDQDCDGLDLTDVDGDGYEGGSGSDCDDEDEDIHPGATELWYDGVDQDCDGWSDYDADLDYYDDQRYGGTDCNDEDPAQNPSATEIWYDGVDQDCDAWSDYDADTDGFDSDSWGGTDCDDGYSHINPVAPEVPYSGIDENCDGFDLNDIDGDGWDGIPGGGLDCDDEDPEIHPGAQETPYDGVDQNCDGRAEYDWDGDGFDSASFGGEDCNDYDVDVHPFAWEIWYDGVDQDCDGGNDFDADLDGFENEDYDGDDCDDSDATVYPGAWETWYDGIDQDCGDDDDFDRDGDGWTVEVDCDDFRAEAYPGAEELRNGLDDDCDGWAEDDDRDEDGAIDWDEWQIGSDYLDPDTDDDGLMDGKEIGNVHVPRDTDLDGVLDVFDTDDDGDGIDSLLENLADPNQDGVADWDVDGDGIRNSRDRDSDGDGYLDRDEGLEDRDWDGVADYIDYNGDFAGGGCGGQGTQWLGLFFLAPLFSRRRLKQLGAAAAVVVALMGLPQPAQAGGVDAHGFQVLGTTGDGNGYTRLAYPSGGHLGDVDAGVIFDYAYRPLVEVLPEGRQPVLSHLTTANLVASGSLGAYTRLELVVPVHTMGVSPYNNFMALGDIRLGAVVPAFAPAGIRPGLAFAPSIWLPTGAEDRFVGNPGLSAGGVITVAQELGRFGYVANVGARVGKFEPERNLQAGSGPLFGLGMHYQATETLVVGLEGTAHGSTGFTEWPLELLGTARVQRPGGAWTSMALGVGLNDDTGSSTVRAVVGGGWQRRTAPPPDVVIQYMDKPIDPNSDRDLDGIVDIEDDCPDQPETFDGFTDEDGCPELDGDQDGVEFARDLCPRDAIYPEQDPRYSDGCPKLAELSGDKIIITQSIFFREDSSIILRKSNEVLDEVARIMITHPEIDAVLIEGHTNNNGGPEYNYRLSEDRANSVMRYLIDAGVPRDRLVAQGYGYDKPLVDHDHPDAKTVNRRVEFTVVKRVEGPNDARRPAPSELPE